MTPHRPVPTERWPQTSPPGPRSVCSVCGRPIYRLGSGRWLHVARN